MKTIFISIPNAIAHRNYALFERSVLDLLACDKNIRTVVLSRRGVLPELLEKFRQRENVVVEEYDESQKKNFIQRAFIFFYSYLIFTPTTKLVSSYGVRSDRPRPLMRFWNYPIKLFIANVLGESEYIKESLVPRLYALIFNKRPYYYLFDKYNPDVVFLTNICTWPLDLEFLVEAKLKSVRTVGMVANWDHLSKYYVPFRPDKLLVWSNPIKDEALKYQGYKKENIKIVGAPHTDFFLDKNNVVSRSEFLTKVNFPQDSKLITFCSQGPYSLDGPDLVQMILNWIKAGDLPKNLRLIIRPHPHGLNEVKKYLPFKESSFVYIDTLEKLSSMPYALNFVNVLYHADIVLTTYSTIAADATIFDRPTVIASFDGYKNRPIFQSVRRHRNFTHFQHILKFGAISVAESPKQLLESLKIYLASPEKDRENRLKLREEVFGYFDRQNSGRIYKEILND